MTPDDNDGLMIGFQGWFMCRLATDPDPTDETRGVSGSTFALAGEPDLDRVIVLQDPAAEVVRCHTPRIGVRVTRVAVDGMTGWPELVGATVDLLGRPRFENRNFVLTVAGQEPIVPFHLRIEAPGLRLERQMQMTPEQPDLALHDIDQDRLQAFGARAFRTDADLVLSASGIGDPLTSRIRRRERLVAERERPGLDRVQRAALGKRIRELDIAITNPKDERTVNMTALEEFDFPLSGPSGADGELAGHLPIDHSRPWRVRFWMGCWDPDALSGFMRGALHVPLL